MTDIPLPAQQGDTFDPRTIRTVRDQRGLGALCESIRTAVEGSYDIETTGLNPYEVRDSAWGVAARVSLFTATLVTPEGTVQNWALPLSHPEGMFRGKWRKTLLSVGLALTSVQGLWAAHNAKFDIRWIAAHTRVDLAPRLGWDTQVVAHAMDENNTTRLKPLAQALFSVPRWDDVDLSKPGASEKVPLFDLIEYAVRDTYWTWRLMRYQRAVLWVDADEGEVPAGPGETEDARLGLFARRVIMPMVRSLSQVEQRGMVLDAEWIAAEVERMIEQRQETYDDLVARYTVPGDSAPSFAPTSKWFMAWAAAAVEAGDLTVDATTPQGRPQWSRHVLKTQAAHGSAVAQTLLDHRHAVKRLEFLRSWLEVQAPDGRVRATYNAGRVVTGRLSSSDPNMQQVTKTLKPAFAPSPGYLIAEIDYSQLELRVAAFLSRDEAMLSAYADGQDLHRLMALRILQDRENKASADEGRPTRTLTLDDVTRGDRQAAKASNFGLLYLQSPEGFQKYASQTYDVILTMEEATTMHGLFFEQWPGMRAWQHSLVDLAHRTGQVSNPLGRIRHLPDIDSGNPYLQSSAERQAVNSPVQSFGSDIMQIAAADVAGLLDAEPVPGVRVVGTVHDSLVVEVPEDDWKRSTARVMRRMINPHRHLERMGCTLDVPLSVEAEVGTRWGLSDVGVIAG